MSDEGYDSGSQSEDDRAAMPSHYVGVGASAGGLEAIDALFKKMPLDSGAAFIVVQHLSPDYKSLMSELLSKQTAMPVYKAEEGMLVEANSVYLIPPRKNLKIFHGRLLLIEQDRSRGIILPIDIFLRSLAEDQGEKAVAVILSGTGSDGMRGIRSIKERGGMVMVQSQESARFDGMPRSAISTGLADYILPCEEMPGKLTSFIHHPYATTVKAPERLLSDEDGMTRIFSLLRETSGIDFTYYKPTTVVRRIERRMSLSQIHELRDYVRLLEGSPMEVNTLYRELLIGITSFFRDKPAFDLLLEQYLPELFEREGHRDIRFWITGCSTGEEAYSLAITARECMERIGRQVSIKIFATDVDRDAILTAGAGIYPESIAADLSPALLTKYFMRRDDNFQVARHVREMVVFAQHNLINDPPFTKIDLVSCRNLLIYLQPVLQHKALDLFNFALDPEGLLFLGTSETTGDMGDYFESLHHKWKLYRCRGRRRANLSDQPLHRMPERGGGRLLRAGGRGNASYHDEDRLQERLLSLLGEKRVPLTLVVNQALEPLHVLGDSRGLFRLPRGKMLNDITRMTEQELSIPIATGIQRLFKDREPLSYTNVRLPTADGSQVLQLDFELLPQKKGQEALAAIFVTVEQVVERDAGESQGYDVDLQAQQRIQDLEQELQFNRESLQATVEELETSNEELQATNEELLASNEELQSTNEELQSVNEELYTVNAEFQSKIMELTELNNDLDNLLNSVDIATIFLDERFAVRKFTPQINGLFQIIDSDIGRPLTHLANTLVDFDMPAMLEQVKRTMVSIEQEVASNSGRHYLLRIVPYQAGFEGWAGAVIHLVDIEPVKLAQQALVQSEWRYATAQRVAGVVSWLWSVDQDSFEWSPGVEELFDVDSSEKLSNYRSLLNRIHPDDQERVDSAFQQCLSEQGEYLVEHRIEMRDGGVHWLEQSGGIHVLDGEGGRVMIGIVRDVTRSREARLEHQSTITHLAERDHELQSLYAISRLLANSKRPLGETIDDALAFLAGLMVNRQSGVAARITLDGQHYPQSEGGEWKRIASIDLFGVEHGEIALSLDAGEQQPLPPVVRLMIGALASALGEHLERRQGLVSQSAVEGEE